MNKILIIPARRHILEAYYEYVIRYLGNEFIIDQANTPYPPYEVFASDPMANGNNPLMKNPDDYDLLIPHFTTHWNVWGDQHWDIKQKNYAYKVGLVVLEPETFNESVAIVAGTSKPVEQGFGEKPYFSVRFGVDTEMFQPYPLAHRDDLFHVGFVGNWLTPRRYLKALFMPLKTMPGIRLMVFPTSWEPHVRPDEVESCGGKDFLNSIEGGDKWYSGLPNVYNQMDVFVRCDIDHGHQFSVMEAAACGVPVVCTDSGYTKELCDAGGGICIDRGSGDWHEENLSRIQKEIYQAVEYLKDNPEKRKAMGLAGRKFVEDNYTWDKFIPGWREFLTKGVEYAKSYPV